MFSTWILQLLEANFMSGTQSQRVLGTLFKKRKTFYMFSASYFSLLPTVKFFPFCAIYILSRIFAILIFSKV